MKIDLFIEIYSRVNYALLTLERKYTDENLYELFSS